jgi:hypothetical protein
VRIFFKNSCHIFLQQCQKHLYLFYQREIEHGSINTIIRKGCGTPPWPPPTQFALIHLSPMHHIHFLWFLCTLHLIRHPGRGWDNNQRVWSLHRGPKRFTLIFPVREIFPGLKKAQSCSSNSHPPPFINGTAASITSSLTGTPILGCSCGAFPQSTTGDNALPNPPLSLCAPHHRCTHALKRPQRHL